MARAKRKAGKDGRSDYIDSEIVSLSKQLAQAEILLSSSSHMWDRLTYRPIDRHNTCIAVSISTLIACLPNYIKEVKKRLALNIRRKKRADRNVKVQRL